MPVVECKCGLIMSVPAITRTTHCCRCKSDQFQAVWQYRLVAGPKQPEFVHQYQRVFIPRPYLAVVDENRFKNSTSELLDEGGESHETDKQ